MTASTVERIESTDGSIGITPEAGTGRVDLTVLLTSGFVNITNPAFAGGVIGDGAPHNNIAAFAAAYAEAKATGQPLYMPAPPVSYFFDPAAPDALPIFTWDAPVSIIGPGSGNCKLIAGPNVTGDLVRLKQAVFNTDIQGPTLQGFTIEGNANADACGMHVGDTIGVKWYDVCIRNFTGATATGLWMDNTSQFTERCIAIGLWLENCKTLLRFTVNGGNQSFGYNRWLDLLLNVNDGQTGISIEGMSFVYNNELGVVCNVAGGVGNTATILDIKNGASLFQAGLFFTAEQTSGTGATGVNAEAGSTFTWDGVLELGGMSFIGAGVKQLFGAHESVNLGVNGAVDFTLNPTPNPHICVANLAANATSTTLPIGPAGQTAILIYAQDNVGGRTIVPPVNVAFAGGAAPAWTVTADRRDIVCLYSDGGSWFETARSLDVGF